jgi:pyrroline-5-carboxylate reductase
LPLREERELNALWASTAIIAAFYSLLNSVSEWSAGNGAAPITAADYTASMAHALTRAALSGGPDRFAHLAAEAATPGGLNEQVVCMLRAGGAYTHAREALDAALARISFQPPTP